MDFNEKNATEAVLNSFAGIKDNRLKEIMSSIITHLHEVVKEVEPTEEEWMKAIMQFQAQVLKYGNLAQMDYMTFKKKKV